MRPQSNTDSRLLVCYFRVHVGGACSHFSFPSMMKTQLCWNVCLFVQLKSANQSVLKLGSTWFSQPNSPTYCWTTHREPFFIFLSSVSFRNMEKSFLWFMPKSLFMLSGFLTLFLCIQLNPSMFYWACVICLFIYHIPSIFPSLVLPRWTLGSGSLHPPAARPRDIHKWDQVYRQRPWRQILFQCDRRSCAQWHCGRPRRSYLHSGRFVDEWKKTKKA